MGYFNFNFSVTTANSKRSKQRKPLKLQTESNLIRYQLRQATTAPEN